MQKLNGKNSRIHLSSSVYLQQHILTHIKVSITIRLFLIIFYRHAKQYISCDVDHHDVVVLLSGGGRVLRATSLVGAKRAEMQVVK